MYNAISYTKKGLLVLLFVLLLSSSAWAGANNVKRVFISESFTFSEIPENSLERFFFFFCEGIFINSTTHNVYLFFSNVKIDENVSGNFYAFFSDMTFENVMNTGIKVNSFFSEIKYYSDKTIDIRLIFDWLNIFSKTHVSDIYTVQDDTINPLIFNLIREIFILGLFSIFLAIRKSFFEQGGLAVKSEAARMLKSGLLIYFIFMCSIVILLLSVFGIFISIILLAVLAFIILVGYASLSLFVGGIAAERTKLRRSAYREMIIGALLLESLHYIPYLRLASVLFAMPVLALGMIYITFMNMYVNKNFYESPYTA